MMIESQTSGSVQHAPKLSENKRFLDLLLTLPFILFFLVQLHHHQLWRDELNVWGIALASPTLGKLAYYIHYEGHPGLWYYLLWFPSRIWVYPAAMKWVEAFIGTGIYLLIGLGSPWTRMEKVLVFLSYYISFEYTVLSRTYGLCVLLALGYIYLRTKRPQSVLLCGLLLGLIANTDIIGVILSGSLLIEYSWHILVLSKAEGRSSRLQFFYLYAIYFGLLILSYLTLRPARDISWATSGRMFFYWRDQNHLQQALLSNLGLPWFPISAQFPQHFWNPNVVLHPLFFVFVSLIATAAIYIVFRKCGSLLTLMALVMIGSILFSQLVYLGYMRQFGVIFLAFLAAYWIKRSRDRKPSRAAVALLLVSAVGGMQAFAGSWLRPFSNSENAANWIRAHHLADQPLAGFPDNNAIAVAEQLHRKMYFTHCHCSESFKLFSNNHDNTSDNHFTRGFSHADSDLQTISYILVLIKPLTPEQDEDLQAGHHQVAPLASFSGAEENAENFYLYEVSRLPQSDSAR